MIPTHVFGFGAREYAEAHGWAGVTIVEGTSLNPTKGPDGSTPEKARRLLITPGEYTGLQGYLGKHAYVSISGAEEERPVIKGGNISGDYVRDFEVSNLELVDCAIAAAHYAAQNGEMRVLGVYQHTWTKERNGIVNPHGPEAKGWRHIVRGCVFDGVGGQGNTTHTMYIEGRPGSSLIVEDCEFRGSRACSVVKATTNDVQLRRNTFRTHSALTTWTAHTMVDYPACSSGVVTDNLFECWGDQSKPTGQKGLYTPPLFIRARQSLYGADAPPYPTESWDPPVTKWVVTADLPDGWPSTAETFVNEDFWSAAAAAGIDNPENPYLYTRFVADNVFRILPGSRAMSALRDDGTHPRTVAYQFGPDKILRTTANWFDRSVTFFGPNTYEGNWLSPQTDKSQYVVSVEPGAHWPRKAPSDFPRAIDVHLQLPDWFRK